MFFLYSILLSMFGTKTMAYDIAVENADGVTIYYNYINDGTELEVTYETTSFSSYSGSVVIPEEITYMNNTLKVTSIGGYAFFKCKKMTSVTIPNSVTSIAERAFQYCSGLTSITIPNSVTSIEKYAFAMCNMPSITVPSSVTSIGGSAFRDSGLTSVTIGAGSIGEEAFSHCVNLTSVTFGSSVTSIGDWAFQYCYSLPSITIPDGVTSMGIAVFYDCRELASVTIGKDVTSIGTLPFNSCMSLTSVKVDPENTTYDSRDNCNAIILTASNKLIAGCQTSTIPNGVKEIGTWAFSHCSGLTSITIPSSVKKIGYSVFSECNDLSSIKVDPENTVFDSRDNCNAIIETASNKLFFGCKNTIIPSGVTSIREEAFLGCSGLTSITIPGSVTSIENSAFRDCSDLTSVTIGNGVTSIGSGAFHGCSSLTSVTFGSSVTSIDEWAFGGCDMSVVITKIENPFDIYANIFSENTYKNSTLYVPIGTIDKYKATEGWRLFVNIKEGEPSGVTSLETEKAKEIKRYALDGRPINDSHKGITIIQMNNGTTQKVVH